MKLELAKIGNHNGIEITSEDLSQIAESFRGDVPVTIGHELDDSMPAYGWIKSVEISEDGQTLYGEAELSKELTQMLAEGRYKNWSIGAGRDAEGNMYLHHVAFLGAVPPMIKDLKIIEMGDKTDLITFSASFKHGILMSDSEMQEFSKLKREKRNAIIKKLSDASAGKLPFGRREELIQLADAQLNEGNEAMVEALTGIFASIRKPIAGSLSTHITTAKSEAPKSVFSKI